jgi:hypothetical protein
MLADQGQPMLDVANPGLLVADFTLDGQRPAEADRPQGVEEFW